MNNLCPTIKTISKWCDDMLDYNVNIAHEFLNFSVPLIKELSSTTIPPCYNLYF